MLLAEIELATVLLGVLSSFITAVALMYKDMRKDMLNREKICDNRIRDLQNQLDEIRNGPCHRYDCPLKQK